MSASKQVNLPSFADEEIAAIAERGPDDIATWARSTAGELGITASHAPLDVFVNTVTRLSDGIELDSVEKLLVALCKAGVITAHQVGYLSGRLVS